MHIIVFNDKDLGYKVDNSYILSLYYKYKTKLKSLTKHVDSRGEDGRPNVATSVSRKRTIPDMIPAFGILMSIMSVICFSLSSLIVKVLSELHSLEILFIRCTIQMIFYTVPIIYNREPLFGVPGHRLDLTLRAIFGSSAAICLYMAYRLIRLADVSTIQFAARVLVIFLAVFILKETLTELQVFIGLCTLFGVIIVAKPDFLFGNGGDSVSDSTRRTQGLVFSAAAAVCTAFATITLRQLKTTPLPVVIIWYSIVAMISSLTLLVLMGQWTWPNGWRQYGLLFGIGVLGISDQFFMTIALHYEGTCPIALTRPLSIVFAFIWDVLLFGEAFDWTSILGACLVIVCIVMLALSKWLQERPGTGETVAMNIRHRIGCCCCCRCVDDNTDCYSDESDVLIVGRQSQTCYDTSAHKAPNGDIVAMNDKCDIVFDQINRVLDPQ